MTTAGDLMTLSRAVADRRARDIPASCCCPWQYARGPRRWLRTGLAAGCAWHSSPPRGGPKR